MKKLTLEWSVPAPIAKVWQALTDADELRKWWSPPGFAAAGISVDLREGGTFNYCFKNDEGQEFWGRGVYQKIEQPNFVSWLDSFSDSEGNPVPASHYGIPGDEIIESMVELFLTAEDQLTKIKMVADNPYDDSMQKDMEDGWNGMFAKLKALLVGV